MDFVAIISGQIFYDADHFLLVLIFKPKTACLLRLKRKWIYDLIGKSHFFDWISDRNFEKLKQINWWSFKKCIYCSFWFDCYFFRFYPFFSFFPHFFSFFRFLTFSHIFFISSFFHIFVNFDVFPQKQRKPNKKPFQIRKIKCNALELGLKWLNWWNDYVFAGRMAFHLFWMSEWNNGYQASKQVSKHSTVIYCVRSVNSGRTYSIPFSIFTAWNTTTAQLIH